MLARGLVQVLFSCRRAITCMHQSSESKKGVHLPSTCREGGTQGKALAASRRQAVASAKPLAHTEAGCAFSRTSPGAMQPSQLRHDAAKLAVSSQELSRILPGRLQKSSGFGKLFATESLASTSASLCKLPKGFTALAAFPCCQIFKAQAALCPMA